MQASCPLPQFFLNSDLNLMSVLWKWTLGWVWTPLFLFPVKTLTRSPFLCHRYWSWIGVSGQVAHWDSWSKAFSPQALITKESPWWFLVEVMHDSGISTSIHERCGNAYPTQKLVVISSPPEGSLTLCGFVWLLPAISTSHQKTGRAASTKLSVRRKCQVSPLG